jgi:hypothetical protein
MREPDEKRRVRRAAIPVGIFGVASAMVPVAAYAGVDLIRSLLG